MPSGLGFTPIEMMEFFGLAMFSSGSNQETCFIILFILNTYSAIFQSQRREPKRKPYYRHFQLNRNRK